MNLELRLQGVLDDSGSHGRVRLATCFQPYTLCLGNVGYLGLQCRHWRMYALKLWRGVAKKLASGGALDEASCKDLSPCCHSVLTTALTKMRLCSFPHKELRIIGRQTQASPVEIDGGDADLDLSAHLMLTQRLPWRLSQWHRGGRVPAAELSPSAVEAAVGGGQEYLLACRNNKMGHEGSLQPGRNVH